MRVSDADLARRFECVREAIAAGQPWEVVVRCATGELWYWRGPAHPSRQVKP